MMINQATTPADEIVGSRQSVLGGGASSSRPAANPSFKRWIDRMRAWAKEVNPPPALTATAKKAWREGMLATYFEEACNRAKEGDFHGANMLVTESSRLMSSADSESESLKRFFRDVATRQSTESCAQSVNRFIERHRRQAVLDITHASILLQADYKSAATYSAQGVEANVRLILVPLVARCRSYAESYAFRMPNIDTDSLQYLENLVDRVGTHGRNKAVDPEMFEQAVEDTKSQEYLECVADIKETHRLADDPEEEEVADAAERKNRPLTELVDKIRSTRRSFRQWVDDRRIMFEALNYYAGSNLEQDGGFGTSLPQLYAQDEFQGMQEFILDDVYATNLKKWVADLGATAPRGVPIEVAFAALGWYFMDTQRPRLAQQAFLEGGYASLTADIGDTLGALASELNGYRLLLTATALTAAPAGAPLPSASMLDEVDILLAAWRSKWIRLGGSPQIADQQISDFAIQSSFKKRRLAELSRRILQDRYFFDDYRFPDGVMPSIIIDSLMEGSLPGVHDVTAFEKNGYVALDEYFRQARTPMEVDSDFLDLWPLNR